jgi:hypothetical protein
MAEIYKVVPIKVPFLPTKRSSHRLFGEIIQTIYKKCLSAEISRCLGAKTRLIANDFPCIVSIHISSHASVHNSSTISLETSAIYGYRPATQKLYPVFIVMSRVAITFARLINVLRLAYTTPNTNALPNQCSCGNCDQCLNSNNNLPSAPHDEPHLDSPDEPQPSAIARLWFCLSLSWLPGAVTWVYKAVIGAFKWFFRRMCPCWCS